jgi:hypothetical protein
VGQSQLACCQRVVELEGNLVNEVRRALLEAVCHEITGRISAPSRIDGGDGRGGAMRFSWVAMIWLGLGEFRGRGLFVFSWGCLKMLGAEGGEGAYRGYRGLRESGCSKEKDKFSFGSAWAAGR